MSLSVAIDSLVAVNNYLLLTFTETGTGDHCEIWRSQAEENNGLPQVIANTVSFANGRQINFYDYAVASSRSYIYFIVATDLTTTYTTPTISASVTLASGTIHVVNKNNSSSNTAYSDATIGTNSAIDVAAVTVLDLIPHSRSYGLATAQYMLAGGDVPAFNASAIEDIGINIIIRIPSSDAQKQTQIRDMITARRYLCYRDMRGNKFFGRMAYDEQYSSTYTDLNLRFQVLDFNEAVI